jgi:dTDP-4-amino-4,6-dideoxygalactose transaminase
MSKYQYNSWPLGKLEHHLQRKEPQTIKEMGYKWEDPRDIIDLFEKKVAEFAGSKYAVSCDCATHGLFLALKYINTPRTIYIPKHTYVSVPMTIIQAGYKVVLEDEDWEGLYQLSPLPVYDGAGRWKKNMYMGGFHVLSFQIKKSIPIGRGGVILTDDEEAYKKLKLMTYDGRDLTLPYDHPEHIQCEGYHYYMTPEDAARGIILIDCIEREGDTYSSKMYPDLSKMKVIKELIK